jgi:hypothetical protein
VERSPVEIVAPWRLLPAGLLMTTTLFLCADARADVVTGPPPPDDCPDGTSGSACFGHGTDFCVPVTCASDAACGEGQICREQELCIGQVDCGWGPPDAGPTYTDTVEGDCAGGAECAEGSCETRRICVTDPVFDNADGCRCAAVSPGRPGGGAFPVGLALVAALLLTARRRVP